MLSRGAQPRDLSKYRFHGKAETYRAPVGKAETVSRGISAAKASYRRRLLVSAVAAARMYVEGHIVYSTGADKLGL